MFPSACVEIFSQDESACGESRHTDAAAITKRRLAVFLGRAALAILAASVAGELVAQDRRGQFRTPAGLAPDPATTEEAVVQVYAARATQWRGYFGVHSWIAAKPAGAGSFTVYELVGYQTQRTGSGVRTSRRVADRYWDGIPAQVLADVRGPGAEALIARIRAAAAAYPDAKTYRIWPGPNSNTFVAQILRTVPEMRVDLPATAIGKDYVGPQLVALTPSGTGAQFNVFGAAGVLAGWEEGIEVNLLGLTFGVNPKRLALKLPLIGNVGLIDSTKPRRLDEIIPAGAPTTPRQSVASR
ncbi:MAG: DUF3750 domain-containing protein [Verrucomicrobia bacterium]|nr:DUF3750 domain-containing protein [Verrucomicrobiota bacterium]